MMSLDSHDISDISHRAKRHTVCCCGIVSYIFGGYNSLSGGLFPELNFTFSCSSRTSFFVVNQESHVFHLEGKSYHLDTNLHRKNYGKNFKNSTVVNLQLLCTTGV